MHLHLLQAEAPPCGELLQELLPRVEAELQGTSADLPEGDGGVGGGDVPAVDHLGLPQPLVGLGQCDLAAIRARLPKLGKNIELEAVYVSPFHGPCLFSLSKKAPPMK